MFSILSDPVTVLSVTLLPLLMAALCAIAATQQRSRPLRSLACGSAVNAFSMPALMLGLPDPARLLSCALLLLSGSLYWLAVTGMMGRRGQSTLALVPSLGWVAFILLIRLMTPALVGNSLLVEMLSCLAVDALVMLLCIPPLATVPARSLSHNCMIAVITLGPVISCFCAATMVWPGLVPAPWVALTMIAATLARSILLPGLAILTAMDMATRRERRLALHDDLSGLLNRRGFFRKVSTMPDRTLMLFDIDHFKRINDTFGHAAGDAAIRRFAQVLTGLVGREAVLGRVGGEEFTVAISHASRDRALLIAERIRQAFADAEQAFGTRVTVSIGIAMAQRTALSVADQLAAADHALYRAKQAGRNRVELEEDPARIALQSVS